MFYIKKIKNIKFKDALVTKYEKYIEDLIYSTHPEKHDELFILYL